MLQGHNGAQPDQPTGWWAVYTKHQHEKAVANLLAVKGLQVFLPLYGTMHRRTDRVVNLALPLFPGYVFIRESPDRRMPILTTPGVFQIVGNGSGYGVITDREIELLRKAVEGPRGVQPHPFLNVGEMVRIICGPLTDVEGILVRRKNMCRVVLTVEMLAQSASVEVNEWEIVSAAKHRSSLPHRPPVSSDRGHWGPQHAWR